MVAIPGVGRGVLVVFVIETYAEAAAECESAPAVSPVDVDAEGAFVAEEVVAAEAVGGVGCEDVVEAFEFVVGVPVVGAETVAQFAGGGVGTVVAYVGVEAIAALVGVEVAMFIVEGGCEGVEGVVAVVVLRAAIVREA